MSAERRAVATLNKKRYNALQAEMHARLDSSVASTALAVVCDILAFDPSMRTYTPDEIMARNERQKQRMQELGLTYYDIKGRAYYHSHRQQCLEATCRYREAQRLRQEPGT